MQVLKIGSNTQSVTVERDIPRPAAEIFKAIGEGRLFLNCSFELKTLQVDFKVGGRYSIENHGYEVFVGGEFYEIVPYTKISFSWNQEAEKGGTPDTLVTILLQETAGKTHLKLTHEGFKTQELADQHAGGWGGGLTDLGGELGGNLRFLRKYPLPIEKLYDVCKAKFKAELTDVRGSDEPGKKFSILHGPSNGGAQKTPVDFIFDTDDDGGSWLELLPKGLATGDQQKAARKEWDEILTQLVK